MKRLFERFRKQCEVCCCYSGNAEGEEIDPDNECSLGHNITGNTECEDFSE